MQQVEKQKDGWEALSKGGIAGKESSPHQSGAKCRRVPVAQQRGKVFGPHHTRAPPPHKTPGQGFPPAGC